MTTPSPLFRDVDKFLTALTKAYNKPFVGDTAKDLVRYLTFTDLEIITHKNVAYAKAFSVVQSSGTGKSRMLTEVCSGLVLVYYVINFLLGRQIYIHTSDMPSQGG